MRTPSRPPSIAMLLLGLVLVATSSTGCIASEESRKKADALQDRLGRPAWASRVSVHAAATDGEGDIVTTTVALEDDAKPDELATFVTLFGEAADAVGLPATGGMRELIFRSSEDVLLDVTVVGSTDEPAVRDAVTRWLAVVETVGPVIKEMSTYVGHGDASLYYVVHVSDADAVDQFYSRTASRPTLTAPGDTWTVTSTAGAPGFVDSTTPPR